MKKQLVSSVLLLVVGLMSQVVTAGKVTYIHTDAQGTPIMESDEQGNITARFDYTPYGVPVQVMSGAPDGPGYTGHVNDPDTGFVYMQARYYDPLSQRFLSVDPIASSGADIYGFNRYGYAEDSPIVNIDPDGRQSLDENMMIVQEQRLDTVHELGWQNVMDLDAESSVRQSNMLVGMVPGVGDAQSIYDAVKEPSPGNVSVAVIGLVPEVGGIAKSALKDVLKLSKVEKSVKIEKIGEFVKKTEVRPGKGPGQTRAEYVSIKNSGGKTVRTYKDTYDRANKFQHRKPLTGGPEGRPVPPPSPREGE